MSIQQVSEKNHENGYERNDKTNGIKNNQTKKKFLRRLLLVIGGLLLGLNLYFANAGGILGNQMPMPFGYGMANVLSGSMEPTFSKGTLLFVKDTRDVQVGDIVVYQSGRELIVHRIIILNDDEVVTQGDANNAADEPFDKAQIRKQRMCWVLLVLAAAIALAKLKEVRLLSMFLVVI